MPPPRCAGRRARRLLRALESAGNPSSVHAEGRAARGLIEAARTQVAPLVGAEARSVTFTTGATEANMLALTPAIETGGRREPRDQLFMSAPSTLPCAAGAVSP